MKANGGGYGILIPKFMSIFGLTFVSETSTFLKKIHSKLLIMNYVLKLKGLTNILKRNFIMKQLLPIEDAH